MSVQELERELEKGFPDVLRVRTLCQGVSDVSIMASSILRRALFPALLGLHSIGGDHGWDVLQCHEALAQFPNQTELAEDAEAIYKRVVEDAPTGKRGRGRAAVPSSPSSRHSLSTPRKAPNTPSDEPVFGIDDESSPCTPTPILAEEPEEDVLSPSIIALLLSRYCHARGFQYYCRDVAHVLAPLLSLRLSAGITYGCLYKFCAAALPRLHNWGHLHTGGAPSSLLLAADDRQYALLRRTLLVQDAALVAHLDSVRPGWCGPCPPARPRGGNRTHSTLPPLGVGCIPAAWLGLLFAGQCKPSALIRLWCVLLTHTPSLQEGVDACSTPSPPSSPSPSSHRLVPATLVAAVVAHCKESLLALRGLPTNTGGDDGASPRLHHSSLGYDFVATTLESAASGYWGDGSVLGALRDTEKEWPQCLTRPDIALVVFDAEIDCVYRCGDRRAGVVNASKWMRRQYGERVPAEGGGKSRVGAALRALAQGSRPASPPRAPDAQPPAATVAAPAAKPRGGPTTFASLMACQLITRTWRAEKHRDLLMLVGNERAEAPVPVPAPAPSTPFKSSPAVAFTSSTYIPLQTAPVPGKPPSSLPATPLATVKAIATHLPPAPAAAPTPASSPPSLPSPEFVPAKSGSVFSKLTSLTKDLTSRMSLPNGKKGEEGGERRASTFSSLFNKGKAPAPATPAPAAKVVAPVLLTPPKAAFGIGSEDGDTPTSTPEKSAEALVAFKLAGMEKGSEWTFDEWSSRTTLFRCRKEKSQLGFGEPLMLPRYLALCGERVLCLEAHSFKMGVAVVKSNHSVVEVAGLNYSKSSPGRVTVKFRHSKAGGDLAKVYHFEDPSGFQSALIARVNAVVKLKEGNAPRT